MPVRPVGRRLHRGTAGRSGTALRWARSWGHRVAALLWVLTIIVVCAAISWWTYEAPMLVLFPAVAAGGWYAVWAAPRAGQHWVTAARHRVDPSAADGETSGPTVLYLRAFDLDDAAAANSSHGVVSLFRSEEQQLDRAFRNFGRLVAVGRPDEELPPVGARRVYPGDEWQARVEQMVRSAALVVVGAGRGAGLRWELELLGRIYDPRRTVLLLPGTVRDMERLLREIDGLLPKPLPPAPCRLSRTSGLYAAAIHFEDDWTARLVVFDADGPGRSLALECRRTLAPVFRAAGFPSSEQLASLRRESSVVLYWLTVSITVLGLAALVLFRAVLPP